MSAAVQSMPKKRKIDRNSRASRIKYAQEEANGVFERVLYQCRACNTKVIERDRAGHLFRHGIKFDRVDAMFDAIKPSNK